MGRRIDLRAELAMGRHALDCGRVLAVAELIARQPRRAERLIELLWDDDAGVASRAADVLERVSAHPSARPTRRRLAPAGEKSAQLQFQ